MGIVARCVISFPPTGDFGRFPIPGPPLLKSRAENADVSNAMTPSPPMQLNDLMTRQIVTVSMDDSLRSVRELFEAHHFHHLLVVERNKLVGVLSDRDLLRHLSPFVGHEFTERPQDIATLQRRVHQIMTRKLITASPTTNVQQAIELILENRIACLPVVNEEGCPVGIITWRDILRAVGGVGEKQAA